MKPKNHISFIKIAFVGALLFLAGGAGAAFAHSGGLNADGCHAGTKQYHCYPASGLVQSMPLLTLPVQSNYFADLDCRDFVSQAQAQLFYAQFGPADPHDLDRDNDGIACERLK